MIEVGARGSGFGDVLPKERESDTPAGTVRGRRASEKLGGAKRVATGEILAGPTRLELATSGVTGRRSNQLNYDPVRVRARARFGEMNISLAAFPTSRVSPSRAGHAGWRACTAGARGGAESMRRGR